LDFGIFGTLRNWVGGNFFGMLASLIDEEFIENVNILDPALTHQLIRVPNNRPSIFKKKL
jgi:hypothetical protein